LKEALAEGRTAVWLDKQLIGRRRYLRALFRESVEIGKPYHRYKGAVWFEIQNHSDIDMDMKRTGKQGPGTLMLAANTTTFVSASVDQAAEKAELSYVVRNFRIAPDKGLPVSLTIDLK
jgi:hypothetical protein